MLMLLITLTVIVFICLVLVAAIQPSVSPLSVFETHRRAQKGDKEATEAERRANLLDDVVSAIRAKVALLLVLTVVLLIMTFGWVLGTIIAVVVALEYAVVARLPFVQSVADKIYRRFEPAWLSGAEKHPNFFRFLRSVTHTVSDDKPLGSRQELQHLVSTSEGVLSADERRLIVHSLSFGDKRVEEVMTPRSMIASINHSEFLGPLILDELHKAGHSRLPVIHGDIDHVIGILHLQGLLALDIKRSVTAEKAMEPHVYYIRQDQTLHHALAAFLRTHHHLFIVVNEFRETVGLLTLEDVIEALIGRKIIDEYDAHEDLRTVALRNPHDNNDPAHHVDV